MGHHRDQRQHRQRAQLSPVLPLPLPLHAACSQHLEVHEEGETIHLDNSQNTEANWTFPPPQAEWDNCRFGPKPLLVSRLQNVLWVWQRESKIFFKKTDLERFPVQLLRVWMSIQMSKSRSESMHVPKRSVTHSPQRFSLQIAVNAWAQNSSV